MIFTETEIHGLFVVTPEPRTDHRGSFMRVWGREESVKQGLIPDVAQMNISTCNRRGTVRGLHYQADPDAEVKVIRCIRGRIYEVAVDVRPGSPSFGRWFGIELTPGNRKMLYVPKGCANGYQALEDDSEILYHSSAAYAPGAERGVRFDDPGIGIEWPESVTDVSEKDRMWPDLRLNS